MNKGIVLGMVFLVIGMGFTGSSYSLSMSKPQMLGFDGNILYVGGNGSGNYSRIQDAIDNASDGDTVFVYDDSSPYVESLFVNISINLIGENRYTTVIDGLGCMEGVYLGADGITISGFTVQNCKIEHAGIGYKSHNHFIINNIIKNNTYGIACCHFGDNNVISNNIVINNHNGIDTRWSYNNIISYNTVENNVQGVVMFWSGNNKIFLNNFCNNSRYAIMVVMSIYDKIFKNNFLGYIKMLIIGDVLTETWDRKYWGRPRITPKLILG